MAPIFLKKFRKIFKFFQKFENFNLRPGACFWSQVPNGSLKLFFGASRSQKIEFLSFLVFSTL